MRAAIFDIETNGLLDKLDRVHVLCINENTAPAFSVLRYSNDSAACNLFGTIEEGLDYLREFDLIIGHNAIKFDVPALAKVYGFSVPWSKVRDTMVLARLLWPDLMDADLKLAARGVLPRKLIGSHSLKAWGLRLGCHKGDYTGGWEQWSQEMEDYCAQDTDVTKALWERICAKQPSEESVLLETQVAHILARQERHGFAFNKDKAISLYSTLVGKRLEVEEQLKQAFKPRFLPAGAFVPKKDSKKLGYVAGAELTKVTLTEFNPGSRDHIASWLGQRGWKPHEFTDNGKPKVDETVLSGLPYPEAKLLADYFLIDKRIGQLAEGNEAWLKRVGADGRVHGSVNTNGAVTGRMTHAYPNMGQVPACYSKWGKECRELFEACFPKVLVGCDADALELRGLAGFMARYDDGAYIEVVLKGDKSLGTDMHSVNARALGLDPKALYWDGRSGREIAKTWFYAFIYGAGDEKLGLILTGSKGPKARKAGKASRESIMANLPALGKLVDAVKKAAKRGYLIGLDKRHLRVRSEHAALNTLLQSAGALQMKRALCILDDSLQAAGLVPGQHYEFVANVHDEWQIETDEDKHEMVGELAVAAIRRAGESFGFRCPLDGQWKRGRTWADTH